VKARCGGPAPACGNAAHAGPVRRPRVVVDDWVGDGYEDLGRLRAVPTADGTR